MRRLSLFAGVILALAVVMPVAAGGGSHTLSYTETFHGTQTSTDVNPCDGNTVDITQTGNSVDHVTYFPASDEVWATFTQEGTFSAVDEGTGVVYQGHSTVWGNFNVNRQNSNSTFTLTIMATGSDGSTIVDHEVTHYTMLPDGTLVVNFDKANVTCG